MKRLLILSFLSVLMVSNITINAQSSTSSVELASLKQSLVETEYELSITRAALSKCMQGK